MQPHMSRRDEQKKNVTGRRVQSRRFSELKHSLRAAEGILEVALLTSVYYLMWCIGYQESMTFPYYGNGKFVLMGVHAALLLVVFYLCDCFQYGRMKWLDVTISQWISVFIVDFITYFQLCLMANVMISVLPMLILLVIHAGLAAVCTYLFTAVYHHFNVPHDMLLIYGSEDALDLKFKMDARRDKYEIRQLLPATAPLETLCRAIDRHDAVILNRVEVGLRNEIVKYCYANGVRAYIAPQITDIILSGAENITLFDTPLRLVKGAGLTPPQRFAKRMMDIALCVLAMIPAAPVMLVIALAIKLEDHGPVFYRQKRVTRDGRVFEILKFRSMIEDAEKNGQAIPATGQDPRITRVGRVIRAARLDELAQILNILKGDMSIVGPRPERVEHVEAYSRQIPEWHFREKVKGGLTGYAQIIGKYNTNAYDKLRLDLMYIENYSLRLDVKLIFMTVRILFSKESTEGFETQGELADLRRHLLEDRRS